MTWPFGTCDQCLFKLDMVGEGLEETLCRRYPKRTTPLMIGIRDVTDEKKNTIKVPIVRYDSSYALMKKTDSCGEWRTAVTQ